MRQAAVRFFGSRQTGVRSMLEGRVGWRDEVGARFAEAGATKLNLARGLARPDSEACRRRCLAQSLFGRLTEHKRRCEVISIDRMKPSLLAEDAGGAGPGRAGDVRERPRLEPPVVGGFHLLGRAERGRRNLDALDGRERERGRRARERVGRRGRPAEQLRPQTVRLADLDCD